MPIDDGAPTRSDEIWAARRVISQHLPAAGPDRKIGCKQCSPDGPCPGLTAARARIAQLAPAAVEG